MNDSDTLVFDKFATLNPLIIKELTLNRLTVTSVTKGGTQKLAKTFKIVET
jgi:hypothetical protein